MRRWLAGVLAHEFEAFVVPGPELLDALGLDAAAAGLRLVASPRHASVLLLVGEIPRGLAHAAATVYAQQPRPRAILALGTSSPSPLPDADVVVGADQADFVRGVAELRRGIAADAWAANPAVFPLPEADRATEPSQLGEMPAIDHAEMAGMAPGSRSEGGMQHDMAEMDHGDMGGGFMSMAAMTRDLPRSLDGLPMEWLDVPFGPLFPGLPGGLDLVLTLDGDTVARAELRHESLQRQVATSWPGPVGGFATRLARLDPLAPTAYWVLACRALERAMGLEPAEDELRRRIAAVERERAASHLAWLGRFGFLLGDAWLARSASALSRQLRLVQSPARFEALRSDMAAFASRVRRTPLLRRRLADVGSIDRVADLVGPVARASGLPTDGRGTDPTYKQLGFEPIVAQYGDAGARLWVRLSEVEQSLELVLRAGAPGLIGAPSAQRGSASGHADIETPRGTASLKLTLMEDQIVDVRVASPSHRLATLVEPVAVHREVADALLGVASLDLSPWELAW